MTGADEAAGDVDERKSAAKKQSAPASAEATAEPGAAVVSRIKQSGQGPSAQRGTGEAALVPTAEVMPTSTLLVTGAASRVAPNILSIAHWDRLLGGALYAPLSRLDWATLLRRTSRRAAPLARSGPRRLSSPRPPRATRRAVAALCPTRAQNWPLVPQHRNLRAHARSPIPRSAAFPAVG